MPPGKPVEIFFSTLNRRVMREASSPAVTKLAEHSNEFVTAYDQTDAKPTAGHYDAPRLKAT